MFLSFQIKSNKFYLEELYSHKPILFTSFMFSMALVNLMVGKF